MVLRDFLIFSLILMRMFGFVLFNPVFGRLVIPRVARVIIAMSLAITVFPMISQIDIDSLTSISYAVILLKELAIGYVLGFVMRLFEMVVVYAGGIMDYEMGLSLAAIYDSQQGGQIPLSGNLLQVFYYLIFFAVDGHLLVAKIILDSYQIVPFGKVTFQIGMVNFILDLFVTAIELAVRFAMPFIILETLTEVSIGILMKVLPSINVFVINLQLKIILGLVILIALISPIGENLNQLVSQLMDNLQLGLRLFVK